MPNPQVKGKAVAAILIGSVLIVAIGLALTAKYAGGVREKELAVKIEIIQQGSGDKTETGDKVSVNYTGKLENGTQFDSNVGSGKPFEFTLGMGQVIKGWDEGLLGMQVGEKKKLTIPAAKAYGTQAVGNIPPNSTLIFEVELLRIDKPS